MRINGIIAASRRRLPAPILQTGSYNIQNSNSQKYNVQVGQNNGQYSQKYYLSR